MDRNTILALGEFLNNVIETYDTCDHTLDITIAWLEAHRRDVETNLKWVQEKGISCDCEFVIKIYIPTRDIGKLTDTKPLKVQASD